MADSSYMRSPELLSAATSRLLIVDMQEKFMPTLGDTGPLIDNCVKLLKAARILEVPAATTEQYPRGLGSTIPELIEYLPDRPSKVRFSCAEVLGWEANGGSEERTQAVLAGIETHVCVLQTALDLMSAGFDVYLVVDALRSRGTTDHDVALKRLSDAGARLVTTEMVLFEWCEAAGSENFKQISRLITGKKD